jgi:hypothetical protein
MTDQMKKILFEFQELKQEEKLKLLRMMKFSNDSSTVIARFAQRHQRDFKKNIYFGCASIKTPDGMMVECLLYTNYGTFKGIAERSADAKTLAIKAAEKFEFDRMTATESNYDFTFMDEVTK